MEISFVVLSGLTIGLVQLCKKIGLNPRFAPLFSLIFGVGLSILAMPVNSLSLVYSIFQGLVIGLTSVGMYSGVKNTIQN